MSRPLSRERIVEAAIRMADREGFDAVTLRKLAAKLNVHVTSLYNHVANLEAVTDGIVERLLAEAKLPVSDFTWEEWVRQLAEALRMLARNHPGAITALQRRPIQGADAAYSFEAAIGAFREAGFGLQDAYDAVQATALSMFIFALEEAARATNPEPPQTDLSALPPERFPNIHEVGRYAQQADHWGFFTETLVAGLAARLKD